tara:strand:- start:44 stop:223 length:180 start_codon:yes stop_codon:yes gene_type:complete
MTTYKVSFTPYDTLTYTYEVEASDEDDACDKAREDFRFDIGYDRSKDFEISNVEKEEKE